MPTSSSTVPDSQYTPYTTEEVATKTYRQQGYRNRNGGLAYAAKYGMHDLAVLGGRASLSVYGPTPYHRRLRASDIRRKLAPREYNRLMAQREQQFGLAPGTIRRRAEKGDAA